ncbi:tyrosine-type recombinase/integrase [Ktedonobacter racemifer]|uniref:Integrase family protein n=1 Tax=Ktedonobacter racemifer DSM 44963 TaxID=485913 RepID=D6U0I6_KTERA|nr:tyrosine-type recombinase/integrase [Ktedonobacter racemifer]EFH82326.1 integrase family protein [Ktedonobacter racemifer DSM 44963]
MAIIPLSPEEVLPYWLEELQANDRARGTIRRYRSAVEGFLVWYECCEQRSLTFATLTPITLVGYRNDLQRTQRRATSTVNGQISALRAFCAWLTEEHYLETNPARHLKLVGRQEVSSREGLDDAQVNALLRQARTSRDPLRNYAIVQVLLQTGIRLDECSQLTLDDIELGERSGRVTIRQGKGNKACMVPLNASVRQALAEYMASRLNCDPTVKAVARHWPAYSSDSPTIPLWLSQKKGILTTSAMRQMIDVLVRDTATRGLVPAQTSAHTLRHTFARNYLAEHPGDLVGLASLLGHTSLDTTRIYSLPTLEQLSTRVEQLRQNAYAEEPPLNSIPKRGRRQDKSDTHTQ